MPYLLFLTRGVFFSSLYFFWCFDQFLQFLLVATTRVLVRTSGQITCRLIFWVGTHLNLCSAGGCGFDQIPLNNFFPPLFVGTYDRTFHFCWVFCNGPWIWTCFDFCWFLWTYGSFSLIRQSWGIDGDPNISVWFVSGDTQPELKILKCNTTLELNKKNTWKKQGQPLIHP